MVLTNKHLKLCEAIRNVGGTPYIVGGFVRDLIMGRDSHDVDIVVVGVTKAVLDNLLVREMNGELVGNSFPVWVVNGTEVALARTEQKTGRGYTGFQANVENVTLQEDLARRDLTINAMAMDPFTNEIIDPFGGRKDAAMGVLRAIGPHFGDDPLRVVRVARFAAQLFPHYENSAGIIDGNVFDYAQEVLDELETLPGERVFAELLKALRSDQPSIFFMVLDRLGALSILFPELSALQGRVQPEAHHPEGDAYVHTLLVIDRARELDADDETMYAAMVHDLGKAVTPDDNLPHHYNHEALGVPLVDKLSERLKAPTSFRRAGRMTAKEHLNIHRFNDLKPVKKARLIARLGGLQDQPLLHRVALASQADAQGRGPEYHDKPYPQRQRLIEAAAVVRGVRGNQFAQLKDGRVIAQKMETARAKALTEAGFVRHG
jgi:tRNA nucleotidyltransferase (CCA-adding enzyme)